MPPTKPEAQKQQEAKRNAEIGRRLKVAISFTDIDQSQIADDLKISRSMMSLYLNGKRTVPTGKLAELAGRLGVSLDSLVPGGPEPVKTGRSRAAAATPNQYPDEDLPEGLANYLATREDLISPRVVRAMKGSHFQETAGVVFDDSFWDEQRQLWEKRLGLPRTDLDQRRSGPG